MEFHQILVSASAGDAVTNTARAYQETLRKVGTSEIFARFIDPRLNGTVSQLSDYERRAHPDDVLIYHSSIGEPAVADWLLHRPERLVLVYHNITPSHYFRDLDPQFAALLEGGKRELVMLRDRVAMPLAVSQYNADELAALGYKDVRVSPLPVDGQRLRREQHDPGVERRLKDLEGPMVLFVGQLMPHKRPDLLIQAFHILVTKLTPSANLCLVGRGNRRYGDALAAFAAELQLPVQIPGWVTDSELASYYRAASCFVSLSEHEGVCVPLVEAMALDVPVVARACAAVPETAANAALVLPPDEDAPLVAEALHLVLTNEPVRKMLIARGRERVAAFDANDAHARLLSLLMDLA